MFEIEKNHCQLLIINQPALHGLVAIVPDARAGAGCVIGFTGKFRKLQAGELLRGSDA